MHDEFRRSLCICSIGVDIDVENGEDSITVSWVDQPFTTSITYFVDVMQILGSSVTLDCVLTDTVYTCTSPGHGPCDRFNFTVIPTDGVNNGNSSEPVTGYFTQATGRSSVCHQLNRVIDIDVTFFAYVWYTQIILVQVLYMTLFGIPVHAVYLCSHRCR